MSSRLLVGDREVGPGQPVFVIAEAGVNHDGDVRRAHDLVDRAADAEADAVKFQTFRADALVTSSAPRAAYQQGRLGADDSQASMLAGLELPLTAWRELQAHAADRGVLFMSTPFDEASCDLLVEIGVPAIKIGSGDATNTRLVRRAARSGRPLFCSTGMTTLGEVAELVSWVRGEKGQLALLHCVSSYPAPDGDVNLAAIRQLAELFDVPTGYSDHTLGRLASVAAVAAGACIIEKHLTTDRSLPGPDHRASLEPAEFGVMVKEIRAVEALLGGGMKAPRESEREVRAVARRSLAYVGDLAAGEMIAASDLALKRPGTGLGGALEGVVVGRRTRRAVRADTLVDLADLE